MDDHDSALLLVMMEVDPEHEKEFNKWYDEEHFPERIECTGFRWGRRYEAVEGSPKYLAIYGLDDVGVLVSEEYQKIKPPSAWMKSVQPHIISITRNVYREITPPSNSHSVSELSRRKGSL